MFILILEKYPIYFLYKINNLYMNFINKIVKYKKTWFEILDSFMSTEP